MYALCLVLYSCARNVLLVIFCCKLYRHEYGVASIDQTHAYCIINIERSPRALRMADGGLHSTALENLCRICGKLLISHRVTHCCTDYPNQLVVTFGVTITSDNPKIHPPTLCNNCYLAMRESENRQKKGKSYTCSIHVTEWREHTITNCCTCSL